MPLWRKGFFTQVLTSSRPKITSRAFYHPFTAYPRTCLSLPFCTALLRTLISPIFLSGSEMMECLLPWFFRLISPLKTHPLRFYIFLLGLGDGWRTSSPKNACVGGYYNNCPLSFSALHPHRSDWIPSSANYKLEQTLSRFSTRSWRVGKGVRNYSVCMRI